MHIVLLTWEYPTEAFTAGGMGQAFGKMAAWFYQKGHQVSVVIPSAHDETVQDEQGNRVIRVSTRPMVPAPLRHIATKWLEHYLPHVEVPWSVCHSIEQLYTNGECDVVIAAGHAGLAYALVRRQKVPTVIRPSCYWPIVNRNNFITPDLPTLGQRCLHAMNRSSIRKAGAVFAPTSRVASMWAKEAGRPVTTIPTPHAAIAPRLSYDSQELEYAQPFALFPSALEGNKGAHILAQAIEQYFRTGGQIDFVLVGRDRNAPDGGTSMGEYIRQRLKTWIHKIHIASPVPHPHLLHMMQRARYIIMPSLLDNLPNAMLEAMSLHKVVIGTHQSGMDELIKYGQNGFLVSPGDVLALTAALHHLSTLPDHTLETMGHQAAADVSDYCNPDQVMSRVEILCRQAIVKFHETSRS